MPDHGVKRSCKGEMSVQLASAVSGTPNVATSVQASLAAVRTTDLLGAQFKDAAARIALPSSRYARRLAAGVFPKVRAAQRTSAANLAVQSLAQNPAWLKATRSLTASRGTQREPAVLKVLGDVQASGALGQLTERLATQHVRLFADAKQLPTISSSVLAGVARPGNDALLGKFEDLIKVLNVSFAGAFATQHAESMVTRSLTLGLSEQFRSSGIVSPAWQNLFQNVQLADGLGSIVRLAATPGPLLRSQTFASGVGSYASVHGVLGGLARDRENALLRGQSMRPAAILNSYFDSLGTRPWRRRTELAGLVGNATAGLVLGESLTSDLDDDDADLLVSAATTELIEPWQEGFDETRAELFAALERLSPHLANLLRGAWFNIKTNGPAAAASAANCLVEVLDQTLHALVDDSSLPAWLSDHGCLGREYVDEKSGRPTRRARLAYALQTRSKRDVQLLKNLEVGLAASLSPLHSQLESGKHGRLDIGVQVVRCHAVAVEGFLINLLLVDG